jgi:hypothetical protein
MKHILIFYWKDQQTWSIEIALPDQEYELIQHIGAAGLSGKTLALLPPPSTWTGVAFPDDTIPSKVM